jgi:hypothetical protein
MAGKPSRKPPGRRASNDGATKAKKRSASNRDAAVASRPEGAAPTPSLDILAESLPPWCLQFIRHDLGLATFAGMALTPAARRLFEAKDAAPAWAAVVALQGLAILWGKHSADSSKSTKPSDRVASAKKSFERIYRQLLRIAQSPITPSARRWGPTEQKEKQERASVLATELAQIATDYHSAQVPLRVIFPEAICDAIHLLTLRDDDFERAPSADRARAQIRVRDSMDDDGLIATLFERYAALVKVPDKPIAPQPGSRSLDLQIHAYRICESLNAEFGSRHDHGAYATIAARFLKVIHDLPKAPTRDQVDKWWARRDEFVFNDKS